jgi:alpha/beta superfamily hydrolase
VPQESFIAKGIRFFLSFFILTPLFFLLAIIMTQDFQFFPRLLSSLLGEVPFDPKKFSLPITEGKIILDDNAEMHIWSVQPTKPVKKKLVAILFPGAEMKLIQNSQLISWLADEGFTTYTYDYRGYGKSSGWPKEQRLYQDAETLWNAVLKAEGVKADNVILIGQTLGAAIASNLAKTVTPRVLILLSPAMSAQAALADITYLKYFTSFLWWRLPTYDNIQQLKKSCLIVAHGLNDDYIENYHAVRIHEAYKDIGQSYLSLSPDTGHSDLFAKQAKNIDELLQQCLKK